MRKFIYLCILLIAAISLTGFSSAADPGDNSISVSTDNDVGFDTLLAVNYQGNALVQSQRLEVPYFVMEFSTVLQTTLVQDNYTEPYLDQEGEPPFKHFTYRDFENDSLVNILPILEDDLKITHRRAREGIRNN